MIKTGICIEFHISPGYTHLFPYGSGILETSPAEKYLGHQESKQNQVTGVLLLSLFSKEDNVNTLSLPQCFKYSSSCRKPRINYRVPVRSLNLYYSPSVTALLMRQVLLVCWQCPSQPLFLQEIVESSSVGPWDSLDPAVSISTVNILSIKLNPCLFCSIAFFPILKILQFFYLT